MMRRLVLGLLFTIGILGTTVPATAATAQPGHKTGPVSWAPGTVAIEAVTGTTVRTQVEVTPEKDLRKVRVRLSHGLGRMARVDAPDRIDAKAGLPFPISIIVTIPDHQQTGVYRGELELKAQGGMKSKIPVSIKVQTASAEVVPQRVGTASVDRIGSIPGAGPLVKDELIVGLDFPMDGPDQRIKEIARQTNTVITGSNPGMNMYTLRRPGATLDQLAALRSAVKALPRVAFVSYNFLLDTASAPNDPAWDQRAPADQTWGQRYMHIPEAWKTTTGSASVKIGVIDRGFAPAHEDLAGNISPSQEPMDQELGSTRSNDYHGNHVAGIACAKGDNGRGIAGVNWNCDLHMYSLAGDMSAMNAAHMMQEAVNQGMQVVNMSVGREPACKETPAPNWDDMIEGMKGWYSRGIVMAEANQRDVLWVMAAGNGCRDVAQAVPASLVKDFPDNVVTVAAVNPDGTKWSGSNYGSLVDVAAPGRSIYSTTCWTTVPAQACDKTYDVATGTSQAAPMVSGVAGLMYAAHPGMTAKEVKRCLVQAATIEVPNQPFKVVNAAEAVNCQLPSAAPCEFNSLNPPRCTSSNPTVSMSINNSGNTSSCTFETQVAWGDGSTFHSTFPGWPDSSLKPYANHTYDKPGTYQIEVSGKVTAGYCSFTGDSYTFTLIPNR